MFNLNCSMRIALSETVAGVTEYAEGNQYKHGQHYCHDSHTAVGWNGLTL